MVHSHQYPAVTLTSPSGALAFEDCAVMAPDDAANHINVGVGTATLSMPLSFAYAWMYGIYGPNHKNAMNQAPGSIGA